MVTSDAAIAAVDRGCGAAARRRRRRLELVEEAVEGRSRASRGPREPARPSRDEASAQVLDDDGTWLDPGDAQCVLEIVDESLPEGGVLARPAR